MQSNSSSAVGSQKLLIFFNDFKSFFYNEALNLSEKGISTCLNEFSLMIFAVSSPIASKSVEIVVMPFKIIFFKGVSL